MHIAQKPSCNQVSKGVIDDRSAAEHGISSSGSFPLTWEPELNHESINIVHRGQCTHFADACVGW